MSTADAAKDEQPPPGAASSQHSHPGSDVEETIPAEHEKESISGKTVTWDGPNDPGNPKNWSFSKRWAITALLSLITFMTPMSSSIIAQAIPQIADEFHITSSFIKQLLFSIILLAYVVGPLFLAPLCEVYGRVIVLQLANIFFLIFTLACGFAQNTGELLAFRFLSGIGGCAPMSIGGGVLSDLWRPEERGMAIGLYTLAPLLSPALGPLLGAWIAEKSTWRWCFWSITIFGVVVQAVVFFTLQETYGPRILQQKAARIRRDTGDDNFRTEFELKDRRLSSILRHSLVRVVLMLTTQPIVMFLAIYFAAIYGIIYLLLSSFPELWTKYYHESVGIGGLNYIAIMIGLTIGAQVGGRLVDRIYRRLKAQSPDQEGQPEFRVPLLFVSTFLVAAGLFMYGWSADQTTFWLVPDIGVAIFSIGAAVSFTCIQTYIIDAYALYAASAIGATAVVRSLTGFGFPLFAPAMYDSLHYGWGNSVLGFATLIIGYAGALTLWIWGKRLRNASPYARGGK